ncbi:MAG: class I SAM-dependent methyltransferase [Planctomycetes bacterium]|nr:class I SAM-dependent methyltransferase [Planctomycetota bacterium]MCB9909079.1 class I SAM-dependent methyltransferase [Planctomycetota bacterium]MCB9911674.1 class I SAM-dependent methyltransferase [Planctomycetota bacterium]HRV81909.1 class I SAM-dependent methyltransferase [Planctomycetota bacterium]
MHRLDPLPAILGATDIYVVDQILRGQIAPPMRIFDAGMGMGRNLAYLLKAGYPVQGLDPNPEAVEHVQAMQRRFAPTASEHNFRAETLEATSFPAGCCDVLLCNAVLHFARDLAQWQAMAEAAWRLLSPGGLFFARLATSIGIESLLDGRVEGWMTLPDGSQRFVVPAQRLHATAREWGAESVDPLKTTVVDQARAMSTWVLRKPRT